MKIVQILNNNVALIKKGNNELIIYSKGISFKKKAGQLIFEEEIEKTYVLDSNDMLEHFSYLLSNTDEEYLNIINEIVAYGEIILQEKANDYLYLTMLDHVDFALKRAKKNQFIYSPLIWEVKKFYPQHFHIGIHALELLNKNFGVSFPEDEAVSIALHFVNLQSKCSQISETMQTMKLLKNIVFIIENYYNIHLDENSLNYIRLITHLRYFIQRLEMGYPNEEESDEDFNMQIRALYPKAYECVKKVMNYIEESLEIKLPIYEETYLIFHIQRVTNRKEKEQDKNEISEI